MESTSAALVETSSEARLGPPPHKWLKRILISAVVYGLVLCVVRFWWGHDAYGRAEQRFRRYREAGQPVFLKDFQRPAIPDDQNAVFYLRKAMASVLDTPNLWGFQRFPANREQASRIVSENRESLRLVRVARAKSGTHWFRSPAIGGFSTLSDGPEHAELARVLVVATAFFHAIGDDRQCVETLRDILDFSRRLAVNPTSLGANYEAQEMSERATLLIEEVAPRLAVTDADGSLNGPATAATREQMTALIAELLRLEHFSTAWRRALRGERTMACDTDTTYFSRWLPLGIIRPSRFGARTSTPKRIAEYVLGPAWELDRVRAMDAITLFGELGRLPDWPTAEALSPREVACNTVWGETTHLVTASFVQSCRSEMRWHFAFLADRRMAAIALAIRLYVLDHGQRPAQLEALVPDYLPAVPADPFARGGRAFGYRSDAVQPMLYSIWLNGADDGGLYGLWESGHVYGLGSADYPFFLDGARPDPDRIPAAWRDASAPTEEDDERIGERGGQDEENKGGGKDP